MTAPYSRLMILAALWLAPLTGHADSNDGKTPADSAAAGKSPKSSNVCVARPLVKPTEIEMAVTSQIRVELSQLPEVRLIAVLDNRQTGKQIPMIWDPLDAPRLSYMITVEPGLWVLSFRSDPLYRTAESSRLESPDRLSISYRAVSAVDCLEDKTATDDKKAAKAPSDWQLYPEEVRLQPFNLFSYNDKIERPSNPMNWKQDIVVRIYTKSAENPKEVQESAKAALRSLRSIWESPECTKQRSPSTNDANYKVLTRFLEPQDIRDKNTSKETPATRLIDIKKHITGNISSDSRSSACITKLEAVLSAKELARVLSTTQTSDRQVSKSIEEMGASEFRSASGRSLSDQVPQIVVDLFSILAEIAFDRAKSKGFAILSARATKLACEELSGKTLRNELSGAGNDAILWWLPDENAPLLPRTCATVRGLRVQEIATSGKAIYSALVADVSNIPLSFIMKAAEKLPYLQQQVLDLANKRANKWDVYTVSDAVNATAENQKEVRQSLNQVIADLATIKKQAPTRNEANINSALRKLILLEKQELDRHLHALDEVKIAQASLPSLLNPLLNKINECTAGLPADKDPQGRNGVDGFSSLRGGSTKSVAFLASLTQHYSDLRKALLGGVLCHSLALIAQTPQSKAEAATCANNLFEKDGRVPDDKSLQSKSDAAQAFVLGQKSELKKRFEKNASLDGSLEALKNFHWSGNTSDAIDANIALVDTIISVASALQNTKATSPLESARRALQMVRAIEKDLGSFPEVDERLRRLAGPLLRLLALSVKGLLTSTESISERDVQLLFLSFAKDFAKLTKEELQLTSNKEDRQHIQELVCPVRFALAVVSECQRRGGCDASAVTSYIQDPQRFLDDEPCPPEKQQAWTEIAQFVSRSLEVVRASRAIPPAVQLRNVTNLVFDVTERLLSPQTRRDFPMDAESLSAMRRVLVGALDQDAQSVVIGFSHLIERALYETLRYDQAVKTGAAVGDLPETRFGRSLRKFSALAAAVASYAQNYSTGDEKIDEKQAKAQRDARKKAIESMMDMTTSRTERAGDWIVSIGINPGVLAVGGQLGPGTTDQPKYFFPQLTLPMGVALQKLPMVDRGAGRGASFVGLHLQASFVDLAQFVNYDGSANLSMDNLRWSDFVTVGVQVGMLLGRNPNAQFVVGIDHRYSPTQSFQPKLPEDAPAELRNEYDQRRGVFRVGAFVSYYVPFFDFN